MWASSDQPTSAGLSTAGDAGPQETLPLRWNDPMHPRLDEALTAAGGVLLRRHHPHLKASIANAVRQRQLIRLLPGIYVRAQDATRLDVKARAACLADPNAVVTGAAAAILGGWDHLRRPEEVTVASEGLRRPQPGFRFERRRIAPELVRKVDGVRIAVRALAALDLAAEGGDFHLEDALRRGVRVADLRRALALSPGRRWFDPAGGGASAARRTVVAARNRGAQAAPPSARDRLGGEPGSLRQAGGNPARVRRPRVRRVPARDRTERRRLPQRQGEPRPG